MSGQCPCPRYWYRVCFYLRFKTWWFPWHCDTTFFVSKHYISLKLTTLHIMYRATHPHIALAQWEANLQLRTFSFSICWPQWLKTGCQNESTTNICLCGVWWPFLSFHSPSVVRIDNRVNFFLFFQSNVTYFRFIQPSIQILDYLLEWLMTSPKIISLFIYFVHLFLCLGVLRLWRNVETLTGLTFLE